MYGENFAPADNEDRDFKYSHVKRGGGGDHYPYTRGTLYEITILLLSY